MKQMTKGLILLATITIFMFSLTACSSKSTVTGKYYNKQNKSEYIELKSDKTFFLKEYGTDRTGEYTVSGNKLSLKMSTGDYASGTFDGDTIIDDEKLVWVKE